MAAVGIDGGDGTLVFAAPKMTVVGFDADSGLGKKALVSVVENTFSLFSIMSVDTGTATVDVVCTMEEFVAPDMIVDNCNFPAFSLLETTPSWGFDMVKKNGLAIPAAEDLRNER